MIGKKERENSVKEMHKDKQWKNIIRQSKYENKIKNQVWNWLPGLLTFSKTGSYECIVLIVPSTKQLLLLYQNSKYIMYK